MRTLKMDEAQIIYGGFIITTTIVTGALAFGAASFWFGNSLINLYLYKNTGAVKQQSANKAPPLVDVLN